MLSFTGPGSILIQINCEFLLKNKTCATTSTTSTTSTTDGFSLKRTILI